MNNSMNNILASIENGICTITINRPNQLNALNKETIAELSNYIGETEENLGKIKAIIITGSGEKAFVAGADIKEFAHFSVEQGQELAAKGQANLFNKIENHPIPVIAAINGFALGGGLELAMACHIRVASDNAKMGLPETSLGVIPGYGGTQRLPQLIGKGRANELIFTAKMIKADEAHRMGLVNHVTTQEDLLNTCTSIAQQIAKNSSVANANAIKAVNAGFAEGIDGYQAEIEAFGASFGTGDFAEGTTAFIEKRKADFPGN